MNLGARRTGQLLAEPRQDIGADRGTSNCGMPDCSGNDGSASARKSQQHTSTGPVSLAGMMTDRSVRLSDDLHTVAAGIWQQVHCNIRQGS